MMTKMPVQTVAEFTTNHMGHLGLLLRMVDAATDAGADWIKMAKKDVDTFYTPEKLRRAYPSPFGLTYRDYRTMFELTHDDWDRFVAHCAERRMRWFATVQDLPSFVFLAKYDIRRWKIASSNARNIPFLQKLAGRIPEWAEIVLSVAGSRLNEIEAALQVFCRHARVWLLHCVAEYPCPPSNLRLGNIEILRNQFADDRVRIGYSGHEVGIAGSVVAMEQGAEMIERHFCLSRHSFVHHIECSLEPQEFQELVGCAKGGRTERKQYWAQLPDEAFDCDFGMTEKERAFLVEHTYGDEFLGQRLQMRG